MIIYMYISAQITLFVIKNTVLFSSDTLSVSVTKEGSEYYGNLSLGFNFKTPFCIGASNFETPLATGTLTIMKWKALAKAGLH